MSGTVEAGGARLWLSTSFKSTEETLLAILPELDDATDTLTFGGDWVEMEPVTDAATIKFVQEFEDIRALYDLFRTADVETLRGIETITTQIKKRDVTNLARVLTNAVVTPKAPGASQVGRSDLTYGTDPKARVYRHLVVETLTSGLFWRIAVFSKVAASGDFSLALDDKATVLPVQFKVFAHSGFAAAKSLIYGVFEMTAEASS